MAELWSDYADSLIDEIDRSISGKYKMGLRELLTDPTKYATSQDAGVAIANMKEDADKHMDELVAGMPEEKKRLEDDMSKISAITQQLGQNISMQSKQHNIALIKPVEISRDRGREDTIVLNSIDAEVLKLIERLVMSSVLIADFSYQYKSYNIGSWLFSGQKNYGVNVYVPQNEVFNIDLAKEELDDMLDEAEDFAKAK